MTRFALLRAWCLPAALLCTVAACGDDGGDDDPDPDWYPSPEEVSRDLDAWKAGALKTCSLDAIFPGSPAQRSPREGWDAAIVKQQAGPSTIWKLGDATLMLEAMPVLRDADGTTEYNQRAAKTATGKAPFNAELSYAQGRCTLQVNGAPVFDELLHQIVVSGVLPDAAVSQPVTLAQVDPGTASSPLGTLAPGAKLVDFDGLATAMQAVMMPPALYADAGALAKFLAPRTHLAEERLRGLVVANSDGPVYRELMVLPAPLPAISVQRHGNRRDGRYLAETILTDDEVRALGGDLTLTWVYASHLSDTAVDRVSDLEVRLRRTGELRYELTSIALKGTEPRTDARAAACVRDQLARLRSYASATPAGDYGDIRVCDRLSVDLDRAIAADKDATAEVLDLISDARRAKAPKATGEIAPIDGGNSYDLSDWHEPLRPLLSALEARGARDVLAAKPSRIVNGFLASVAALDLHATRAEARTVLVAAAADRAIDAAAALTVGNPGLGPLTDAVAARIGAALRSDDVATQLAGDTAHLIRDHDLGALQDDAGLACLAGTTLDAQRASIAALARRGHGDEARSTWSLNVLIRLLAFDYRTAETHDFAAAYCQPGFVVWAVAHAGDARPPCAYEGVVFDRNDYCAK